MLGARDLESDRNVERGAEMRLKLILRDGRITKRAGRQNRSPRGGEALEPQPHDRHNGPRGWQLINIQLTDNLISRADER